MSSRRPRRQRRRPRERASTLPRPAAGGAAQPASTQAPTAAAIPARPERHIATDYGYVRRDLVAVGIVGALTLAFVLVAAVIA